MKTNTRMNINNRSRVSFARLLFFVVTLVATGQTILSLMAATSCNTTRIR